MEEVGKGDEVERADEESGELRLERGELVAGGLYIGFGLVLARRGVRRRKEAGALAVAVAGVVVAAGVAVGPVFGEGCSPDPSVTEASSAEAGAMAAMAVLGRSSAGTGALTAERSLGASCVRRASWSGQW